MQSVDEAAGGSHGLLRLAEAWHARVMADQVVSHAFSHGLHPRHNERLAAYWAEALAVTGFAIPACRTAPASNCSKRRGVQGNKVSLGSVLLCPAEGASDGCDDGDGEQPAEEVEAGGHRKRSTVGIKIAGLPDCGRGN